MVMDAAKGALEDVSTIMGKLTKSTGKAAWIAGTAFLILVVPLIIEMDREQQLVEFEGQQLNALTGMAAPGALSAGAPIMALYRSILRIHRVKLPTPMREMGDRYVREEFKSHIAADTTQEQWALFVAEWHRYRNMLAGAADVGSGSTVLDNDALVTGIDRSGEFTDEAVADMSQEQRDRLTAVRRKAMKIGRGIFTRE